MYIGTYEHRNVELPTASDGLAGHGLGLGRVYGSHMSRFPCSFGSVRASVARNTPWHSPPSVISHPLDFERAAATATGECIREAFGRFRDGMQRAGGVGVANVTKTRRSAHFEGVFRLPSTPKRGELTARGGVFDSGRWFYSYSRATPCPSETVGFGKRKSGFEKARSECVSGVR